VGFAPSTSIYVLHRHLALIPEGAAQSLPVLPLQVGFLAVALALTGFAVWLRRHKRWDGQVALTTMFLFAASTAMLEPLRGYVPESGYWGHLPKLAWETLAIAVACGAGLLLAELRHRRSLRDGVVVTPA
jgi:hypothetical protein